jgi:hypothetical protein
MYQPTLDTWSQNFSYVPEISRSFPSDFFTNISYQFHISFKPPFATQLSRHILSNVFVKSFHIAVVFQYRTFDLSCLSYHVLIKYNYLELKSITQHLFRDVFTVVT